MQHNFSNLNRASDNKVSSSSNNPNSTKKMVVGLVATADICDANSDLLQTGELKVLLPPFKSYGRQRAFHGPVVTTRMFEENGLVRPLLESEGNQGKVLVIDGGGSMKCALVGGTLSKLAHSSGWVGIVVNGCIRDVDEINECDIGVYALGANPVRAGKESTGEKHVSVSFAGALINDGDLLWADNDGILVYNHKHGLQDTSPELEVVHPKPLNS